MIWFLSDCGDKELGSRPKSADFSKNSTPEKARNIERFREAVESFGKGHYILISNNPKHVKNIDVLCHVKWCVVFDLDPYSNHTGLLSRIGKKLSENTLLNKLTWQDTKCTITETSLTWIGIAGLQDRPDSVISGDFRNWKKKVKTNFEKQLKQILAFSDQYTFLTVVVLWSSGQIESEHMQYMITEILECLSAKVVIVLDRGLCIEKKEKLMISLFEETENVAVVDLTIEDVCAVIHSECAMTSVVKSGGYQLPTSDATNNPGLSDTEAKWLKEDLDVLYFQNPSDSENTAESLKEQEMIFYRGGTLPWSWWYEVGAGTVDIERDIHIAIVNFIRTRHIKQLKSGYIKLYHNPGSGGTTVAQRVVWHLRHEVPCLQIKHRYESQVPDIFERIKMLYDKTHLPVIVLVDGEEERRADSIFHCLRDHVTIVLLYVQRYWIPIMNDKNDLRGSFWLKCVVSKHEVTPLERQYLNQCSTQKQKNNIKKLSFDVRNGLPCTFLEFGLAVYDYEYSGIKNYVAGYIKLNQKESVKDWQKALAYLSFVYFFGQSSLPCNFFSGMFESNKDILKIEDLPKELAGLIVKDNQEKKNNMIRISHYLVAKEILNQVLPFPKPPKEEVSPNLAIEAKRKLADFSVEFIKFASQKSSEQQGGYISYVMKNTIISRNNKAVGENETQASNKKRPQFSPLLEQASMREPYTERFEILQQLTRSFPLEAHFKAHLGRLYAKCRPEKGTEAEKCFQEALNLSLPDGEGTDIDKLPYSNRLDLMHIYHMYGNMKLTKVSMFTGKYLGDRPHVNTNQEQFEEVSKSLLSLVREACGYFTKSRDITPLGSEESMGYICEIHVRLMFASFVNSKGGCESVHKYMDSMNTEEAEFLRGSCVIIDELFLECFSAIDPDKMDSNVRTCQEWYHALFKHVPGHLIWNSHHDDLRSRRFEITKIKMKYGDLYAHGVLEKISSASEIQTIVNVYEKNFLDYANGEVPVAKRTMDIEYKEWLIAIRLDLFKEDYPVEKVLKYVENWHERLNSPNSRFYLFVLKSILGFGISNGGGNTKLLIEAQQLKEEILKFSRQVTKPKYPREWLGKQQNSIKRLYRGLRFFGQIENREIKSHDLELCKGTIISNDKPTGGFIDLYLGPHNRINANVFFVPARAEGNLTGSINRNERVEFVIGFTMLHGYEAFNVRKLRRVTCQNCQIEVEILSNEKKAKCQKCCTFVSCKTGGK